MGASADLPHLFKEAGLSPEALRVYEFGVGRVSFVSSDLDAVGLSPEDIGTALTELESLRLVRRAPDDPNLWHTVHPRLAARQLISPVELEIQREHERLEQLKVTFEGLVPHFEAKMEDRRRAQGLELIPDLTDVRTALERLTRDCRTELLAAQPGGARDPEALADALTRDKAMVARGVTMRTLYQHTARYSQPTIAYVEQMAQLGAEVRTLSDGLSRMLIFDREVGVLSVQGSSGSALLVHEPNMVMFMVASFQHAWQHADPFPHSFDRNWAKQISSEIKVAITSLLAEGLEDKAIARRLGMSERTCQRHVSEIMSALDAKSRFQVGYLIGRHLREQTDVD